MGKLRTQVKLVVILHADVAGFTQLVQLDERLTHQRIHDAYQRFAAKINQYQGRVLEIRGDAILAEFARPSDAVSATFAFHAEQAYHNARLEDEIRPRIRVGIAMGEVVATETSVIGTGVVMAQRVEQMAEPGGLCITAAVHESLPRRMPFDLEDLGVKQLKGIDDPVQVYQVQLTQGASIPPPHDPKLALGSSSLTIRLAAAIGVLLVAAAIVFSIFPTLTSETTSDTKSTEARLLDEPSIAVLPFSNMSDDSQQEYFVDGMTEDLITDLSKLSGLFVIARNSVFTYKNQSVKTQQIARELGVRYVLEGSVRKIDNQVRINAQLIDATTGGHLWADRYDGEYKDVFSLQDKITERIVSALSVKLTPDDQQRQIHKYTENIEAYDAYLQARSRLWFSLDSKQAFDTTVELFENALELDPSYGHAHAALANLYEQVMTDGSELILGFAPSRVQVLAWKHVEQALKNPTPLAHRVRARLLVRQNNWKGAIREAETAIDLNPNDWDGYYAMSDILIRLGKPAQAQIYLNEVKRLNPRWSFRWQEGSIQFQLGQYDRAAAIFRDQISDDPEDEWYYLMLAACYGQLGLVSEGEDVLRQFNEIWGGKGHGPYSLGDVRRWNYQDPAVLERISEGLHIVGMR